MKLFRKKITTEPLDRLPGGALKALDGKTMFVGLGGMKTGTSWLSHFLKNHPEVYHSSLNEVNFFNTLVPNVSQSDGHARRRFLINQLIQKDGPNVRLRRGTCQRLYDYAEIDQFGDDIEKYLSFFAARIGSSKIFGEISPSYATLPPEGIRIITNSHPDTRLFLTMRDPTARAVSQIQHRMRYAPDLDIDTAIEKIVIGSILYDRSNYPATLRAVREGAPDTKFLTLIYEDLFTENSIRKFCNFLGISYKQPRFEHRINFARTKGLSDDQNRRIRQILSPVYDEMQDYFGDEKPTKWLW